MRNPAQYWEAKQPSEKEVVRVGLIALFFVVAILTIMGFVHLPHSCGT